MVHNVPLKKSKKETKTHYTRSKTNQFISNYSFEDASKEWNKNKIKKFNGCYIYINS